MFGGEVHGSQLRQRFLTYHSRLPASAAIGSSRRGGRIVVDFSKVPWVPEFQVPADRSKVLEE
jgi:hypothetical protein